MWCTLQRLRVWNARGAGIPPRRWRHGPLTNARTIGGRTVGSFGKNLALWIIIGLVLVALFQVFQGSSSRQTSTDLAFSQFLAEVEAGQVQDVTI